MGLAVADDESRLRTLRATLLKVFLAALAVRWTYALLMYAFMGDDGLKGSDSIAYAAQAQSFAEAIRAHSIHGLQWLGVAPYTMPFYQWLTALPFLFLEMPA